MLVYNNLSIIISALKQCVKAKKPVFFAFMRIKCIYEHMKSYIILFFIDNAPFPSSVA